MAKQIKYTSIASNRPVHPMKGGTDTYTRVVGGGPQGGVKGKKKPLPNPPRNKRVGKGTNPGL